MQKLRVHQECELEKAKFQLEIMEGLSKEIYSEKGDESTSNDIESIIEGQILLLEKESGYLHKVIKA